MPGHGVGTRVIEEIAQAFVADQERVADTDQNLGRMRNIRAGEKFINVLEKARVAGDDFIKPIQQKAGGAVGEHPFEGLQPERSGDLGREERLHQRL